MKKENITVKPTSIVKDKQTPDKNQTKTLFKEKLDKANRILKIAGLPKFLK